VEKDVPGVQRRSPAKFDLIEQGQRRSGLDLKHVPPHEHPCATRQVCLSFREIDKT
jgi:hypothetical protein